MPSGCHLGESPSPGGDAERENPALAGPSQSRRADSNRRPLHYEGLKDENGRASDDALRHESPAKTHYGQLSLWSE